ncbi:hypothetical protein BOSEA31B_11593 [Hyphomicrobiales bacterium]|nr:hypothetical protein BOSEA31B_11593 [Hyphomicrobiales bacterium]CAH1697386.1 hypothetical protein BOSEA1005_10423 [Hyphomicrobiales bacterium]CAI0345574.1 hypothetical protein BO1005MUT1_30089 [Hyphomicrobiales bacterium]
MLISLGNMPSSRAWPGIHAGAFPAQVQAWIPDLRFAPSGMTRAFMKTRRTLESIQLQKPVAKSPLMMGNQRLRGPEPHASAPPHFGREVVLPASRL